MKLYLKSGKYQEPILELEHSILHKMFYKFHPTSSIPTPPPPPPLSLSHNSKWRMQLSQALCNSKPEDKIPKLNYFAAPFYWLASNRDRSNTVQRAQEELYTKRFWQKWTLIASSLAKSARLLVSQLKLCNDTQGNTLSRLRQSWATWVEAFCS